MEDNYMEEEFNSLSPCCHNYCDELDGKTVCRSCKKPVEPLMDARERAQFDRFFDLLAEKMSADPIFNEKRSFILDDENKVVPATTGEHMRFTVHCHMGGREFRVGKTKIGDTNVSTVFVGEKNCIFETMISGPGKERFVRWETWAEAEAGHKEVCELVRKGDDV